MAVGQHLLDSRCSLPCRLALLHPLISPATCCLASGNHWKQHKKECAKLAAQVQRVHRNA